jgi:hypothetical protein
MISLRSLGLLSSSGDGLLKESISYLNGLDEEISVCAVRENLTHRFLKKHSSDLASLSRIVLLNKGVHVISEELLLFTLWLVLKLGSININKRNNLAGKGLTEELALSHLVNSSNIDWLRDMKLNNSLISLKGL